VGEAFNRGGKSEGGAQLVELSRRSFPISAIRQSSEVLRDDPVELGIDRPAPIVNIMEVEDYFSHDVIIPADHNHSDQLVSRDTLEQITTGARR